MEKKRLLVVGNVVPQDWEFHRGVEAATGKPWDVQVNVINRYDGLHRFTRYLTYLFAPLRLFFIRNRYEKIVYWEQFLGLVLVFYCRLFHVKKCPEISIMALIYKPKGGLIGKVFAWFVRYAVTSEHVRRIIVYSQSEVEYYSGLFGVPKGKFVAETLGQADRPGRLHHAAVRAPADTPAGYGKPPSFRLPDHAEGVPTEGRGLHQGLPGGEGDAAGGEEGVPDISKVFLAASFPFRSFRDGGRS